MRFSAYRMAFCLALLALCVACATPSSNEDSSSDTAFRVPVEYYKLDNGLKVVLSTDSTAPIVTVAAYYNIGFRLEPRDRTGFAHLFEHMMFQGSKNLGKGEFNELVQEMGGVMNGSTRFDFTNYFEIVPAHTLETILWAEADRMRGLAITQDNLTNQQGVVKNEVRVNVLNRPYGGFPWLDLPQTAFTNWHNAHNFYGDLEDLDAATLGDVQAFFDSFYAPNNAALAVVGDFEPGQAKAWIEQYFGSIPAVELPPPPDITEPRQEEARSGSRVDPLANRPAFSFGYQMPQRNTPEFYAMGLIDQIMLQGDDSRLHQVFVQEKGMTSGVGGGINSGLGNMFNYKGPMLWQGQLFHDTEVSSEEILAELDRAISQLHETPVDADTLARARIKLRSSLYDTMGGFFGFGRADLLASFALFDDDPNRINEIEEHFEEVTPELIQRTAQEYLRSTARTVFTIEPGAGS